MKCDDKTLLLNALPTLWVLGSQFNIITRQFECVMRNWNLIVQLPAWRFSDFIIFVCLHNVLLDDMEHNGKWILADYRIQSTKINNIFFLLVFVRHLLFLLQSNDCFFFFEIALFACFGFNRRMFYRIDISFWSWISTKMEQPTNCNISCATKPQRFCIISHNSLLSYRNRTTAKKKLSSEWYCLLLCALRMRHTDRVIKPKMYRKFTTLCK